MKEPSVLDYVKSKIAFWSHSPIAIPPAEPEPLGTVDGIEQVPYRDGVALAGGGSADAPAAAGAPAQTAAPAQPAVRKGLMEAGRLLTLSGLLFALVAQAMLEPPNRAWLVAVCFYGAAAVMIGVAYFWKVIHPALPEQVDTPARFWPADLTANFIPLALSWAFLILTFGTFGKLPTEDEPYFYFFNSENALFSLNTIFWLLSIILAVWAFYIPGNENGLTRFRERVSGFFRNPGWRVSISRWTLLVLLVTGVVLFFRFYRLDTLPNEAVSDQAEKLLDVYDVLNGETRVFFTRNTGREAFQFYWTALMVRLFNTGVTFFALKLGTTLIGLLALVYIYRLGKVIGNRWVALWALLFCGFSYWAQTQARVGLRFTLYAGFFAPVLFHLVRGLLHRNRNDFIWAGLWLGIGLHGYTAFRIVPFVVVAAFVIYILHQRSPETRRFALWGLVVVAFIALVVFMPLMRYSLDNWDAFALRSWSRLGTGERELPGDPVGIFLQNSWNALTMFFWKDGDVWVHSVPHRPALDVVSAALFFLGLVLLVLRYYKKRSWVDLFFLVSIPMLLLPSILSLAFPNENPNLNRTSAAYVPAFLILAISLEALLSALKRTFTGRAAVFPSVVLGLGLVLLSARANFDLVFNQYDQALRLGTWDSTEMGEVVRDFSRTFGNYENAWVVAYPYWVDTRLVGIAAGYPTRDTSIFPEDIPITANLPGNKLFILNPEDTASLAQLQAVYPQGSYWLRKSEYPGKDFIIFITLEPGGAFPDAAGVLTPAGMPELTGQQ